MKIIISALLILSSIVIFGLRIAKNVQFTQNVSGYLKRASDANTIQLADEELTKVISYLEAKNLTNGYTSILWETPDEDISYWYKNLKASQNELQTLKSESALERTNVLIKLRETLVDTGERTRVTIPKGLAVYPNNRLWALLMVIATLAGLTGIVIAIVESDRKARMKAAASVD